MSASRTKFPKNPVPARRMHQSTTIVGKNGLPVDALATVEPGSTLLNNNGTAITYSAPTITFDSSVDLSPLANFGYQDANHTGALLFTDDNNNSYFIDPDSINNIAKTMDVYIDPAFSTAPSAITLSAGWSASEAELVNRLQTTTTAVVDSIEFRDVQVNVDLDGSTVNIKDDDGDQLEINEDGSTNSNIVDSETGNSAEVNTDRELQVRDDDANTTLEAINNKLVDGTDIGDVTVNNTEANPVPVSQQDHDDLNANANIQVEDTDVTGVNPVPVGEALFDSIENIETNISLVSAFNTAAIDIQEYSRGMLKAVWTGANDSNDATFVIEVSDNSTDWSQLGESGMVLLQEADTQIWQILEFPARYMRLVYTENSNDAGTVDITFMGRY